MILKTAGDGFTVAEATQTDAKKYSFEALKTP